MGWEKEVGKERRGMQKGEARDRHETWHNTKYMKGFRLVIKIQQW